MNAPQPPMEVPGRWALPWAGRLGAVVGLAIAGTVGLWWLGSTRLALLGGADTARPAAQALLALLLLRGMALALLAPRDGVARGFAPAAWAAATLLAPGWPLAALAWQASAVPAWALLAAEALLLAAAPLLAAAGAGLAPRVRRTVLEPLAQAAGVLLAAGLWQGRAVLAAWLG